MEKRLFGIFLLLLGGVLLFGTYYQLPKVRLHEGSITPHVAWYIAVHLLGTLLFVTLGALSITKGIKLLKPKEAEDV